MTVRIRLLGRVSIQRDGEPTDLPSKALELLCFLLLHRDRAHTREELSALLWPDARTTLARKYLRQALWQLQSALGAELLLLGNGWVRVDADADWWLDVDAVAPHLLEPAQRGRRIGRHEHAVDRPDRGAQDQVRPDPGLAERPEHADLARPEDPAAAQDEGDLPPRRISHHRPSSLHRR